MKMQNEAQSIHRILASIFSIITTLEFRCSNISRVIKSVYRIKKFESRNNHASLLLFKLTEFAKKLFAFTVSVFVL